MLAVAGGKGGCGKTTTALGIGLALGARRLRPLLVDADVTMPDLHHRTGVDRPGELESGTRRRARRFPTLDVLPVPTGAPVIGDRLTRAADHDGPVLLDCPAGASPDAAAPFRFADATVLVASPTEQSLRDAAKTAAMARRLGAPPALVVLTRSDGTVDPAPLLGDKPVVHVPEVPEPPLETEETRERYAQAVETLAERNL